MTCNAAGLPPLARPGRLPRGRRWRPTTKQRAVNGEMWAVDGAWARFQSGHSALVTLRRTPFWRGGTSDASKSHGSDGAASAPRLSIHLSRCGLAFTPFVSGCNTHRIVARHGLGRHWRPRGKRPGRASGGRPRVTRRGRHRTSPALHVTRKTRGRRLAVAPLHHGAPRCDGCFTPRQTV